MLHLRARTFAPLTSLGTNLLAGGSGSDVLIANRGGNNVLAGGGGDDLIVLKESADLVDPDGSIAFGIQHVSGGRGLDTLRFIVNDQAPATESAFINEFQRIAQAFDCVGPGGSFRIDGLDVTGIERLELQVDSVSTDPATPYLITHTLALSVGSGLPVGGIQEDLLAKAEGWNLLTV
jgi:Ca2+-binding RTX toxin-like protein